MTNGTMPASAPIQLCPVRRLSLQASRAMAVSAKPHSATSGQASGSSNQPRSSSGPPTTAGWRGSVVPGAIVAVVATVDAEPCAGVAGAVVVVVVVAGAASSRGADCVGSSAARTMIRLLAEYRGWHEVNVRIGWSLGASTSYCDGDTMNCSVTL